MKHGIRTGLWAVCIAMFFGVAGAVDADDTAGAKGADGAAKAGKSAGVAGDASAAAGEQKPLKFEAPAVGPWQMFVDDGLISTKTNIIRRYHPFKKMGDTPLIVVDKPWEAHVVNACSVIPTEDGTGLRMYYYCWTNREDGESGSYMCYATSKDGVKWEKPNLGQYDYKGSKDNNILDDGPGAVMYTPWESDPNMRYQGVGGIYDSYASPDGVKWTLQKKKIVSGGDTSHFFWDPNKKKFIALVKVIETVSGLTRRSVGYSESTDLKQFPPLRLIMSPDDDDDTWAKPESVQRTHFYACPTFPYESVYVGFVEIYRPEDNEGYFHGPLWVELVTSRDGFHFNREEYDRPPLLPIGKFRKFDDGMVIATNLVVVGDEVWTYYTGYDEDHDRLPYKSCIGLAKMRKHGFVSVDADEAIGEIVTKPIEGVSGEMQINCDPRKGSIRVEVLDVKGQPIAGFTRDECEPVTKDSVRNVVIWRDNKTLPAGQTIRLRFIMEHAVLYSFLAGENIKFIDEPTTPLQALFTFEGNTEAYSDLLPADGLQTIRNLGSCVIDHKKPNPAFGKRSLIIGSSFRPWNRVEITGTQNLGRKFTLALTANSRTNKLSRLFTSYSGKGVVNTSELIFDCDPSGRAVNGLRLWCKGISVESNAVTFTDGKYHHFAVTYDDGSVTFYLDGKSVGHAWLPGGETVKLSRNLLVGEDAGAGSNEQLHGSVDDILVIGRVLSEKDISTMATKGAAEAFGIQE